MNQNEVAKLPVATASMTHYILIDHLLFTRCFQNENNRLTWSVVHSFTTPTQAPILCAAYVLRLFVCCRVECESRKKSSQISMLMPFTEDYFCWIRVIPIICFSYMPSTNCALNSIKTTISTEKWQQKSTKITLTITVCMLNHNTTKHI